MIARAALALAIFALGMPLAAAQKVSPGDLPGRERERFTTSPVERFMQPGPYTTPPVIEAKRPSRKPPKRRNRAR